MAEAYRNAELPFKIYDIPNVEEVRRKWTDSYLVDAMNARIQYKVEQSTNNHFMYWQHKVIAQLPYLGVTYWLSIRRVCRQYTKIGHRQPKSSLASLSPSGSIGHTPLMPTKRARKIPIII